MEYCSGHGLLDFMNAHLRDLLSETQILQIAYDIAAGLAYMHYQNPPLIHRDLKIENVLISSDGVFKLCDFGSASPVLRPPRTTQEYQILEHDIQNRTTMQYRSPEMVDISRGFPIDEKSDIWAFGVFVYKLCYYTTPFEKEGDPAILSAKYTFPSKPAFSDRLKRLIRVSLSEDPRNRPNIFQIHKEISDMRGSATTLKDIYVSPTSTQQIESREHASATETASTQASTPQKPVSPAKAAHHAPPKPLALLSAKPLATQPQQQSHLQKQLLQQKSELQAKALPALPPKLVATLDADPFISDDFDPEKLNPDDVASKYPTIEELTMSLEQQSLGPGPNPVQPNSFSSSQANLASYPYSVDASKQAANIYPSSATSPWAIPQSSNVSPNPGASLSTTPNAATTLGGSFSSSQASAASNSQLYVAQYQKQSVPKFSSTQQNYLTPQQYKPVMVSHSTMTSPVVSRSHTPAAPINVPGRAKSANPLITTQDASSNAFSSSSSSSEDEQVIDGTRAASYKSPQLGGNDAVFSSSAKSATSANTFAKPSGRSSEERNRVRPVSMYIQGSDSLLDTDERKPTPVGAGAILQPHANKSNPLLTLSQPEPQSAVPLPEVTLIEPVVTDEKDRLKALLTGLSEKSSTMVLDSNESYIDNGVDFLKALHRESTGRSRHNRSPSGSSIHEDLAPPPSTTYNNNGNRKSSFHNKKSSVSLKHAVSTKIGDAFKMFEGSGRRSDTKSAPLANLKNNKYSYSTESLGTYDDYNPDAEFSSYRTQGMTRHTSVRLPSQRAGSSNNGTVHTRIQALMNSRNEPAPPKTATGYGKYTDRHDNATSNESDEEGNASTIQPTRSYTSIPHHYQTGRASLDLPRNDQRKSFDFGLRSGQKESFEQQRLKTASSASTVTSTPATGRHRHIHRPHIHRHFSRRSKNQYSDDLGGYHADNSESSGVSSGDEDYIEDDRNYTARSDAPPSTSSKLPADFHVHKRQLSTISSASSSTEGSSYYPTGQHKRPPSKPTKPAHLKSPRRVDSDISDPSSPVYSRPASSSTATASSPARPAPGSSNPAINKLRLDLEKSGATTGRHSEAIIVGRGPGGGGISTTSTGQTNNSNLIDITPTQSPIGAGDDWKDAFNHKYPNLV